MREKVFICIYYINEYMFELSYT